jgi:hypothetical protein
MILGNAKNPTGPVPVREAAAGSRLSVVSAEIRMLGIQEIRQAQMPKPSGAVSLTRKNTKNRTLPGFQKTEKYNRPYRHWKREEESGAPREKRSFDRPSG